MTKTDGQEKSIPIYLSFTGHGSLHKDMSTRRNRPECFDAECGEGWAVVEDGGGQGG